MASQSGETGYWKKVGVQLPRGVAEEWLERVAAAGRGRGRMEAAAAMVVWLEMDEAGREAVLAALSADLMLERELAADARRTAGAAGAAGLGRRARRRLGG